MPLREPRLHTVINPCILKWNLLFLEKGKKEKCSFHKWISFSFSFFSFFPFSFFLLHFISPEFHVHPYGSHTIYSKTRSAIDWPRHMWASLLESRAVKTKLFRTSTTSGVPALSVCTSGVFARQMLGSGFSTCCGYYVKAPSLAFVSQRASSDQQLPAGVQLD